MSVQGEDGISPLHIQPSLSTYEQNEQFALLLDLSQDPLFLLDQQGRFTYLNRAAKDLLAGLAPSTSQYFGKTARELDFPVDFLADLESQVARALSGQATMLEAALPIHMQIREVECTINPISNGSGPIQTIAGRIKDIHERNQEERQARTFDTALTAIKDFVYTFDTSGRFTYSNKPLLDLLGITLEEIVGKNFHDLPYPRALATTLQIHIAQVISTKQPLTAETPYTNPTGNQGYYEYIFAPVFDDKNEVVAVAGSTRDITERKQFERQKDEFMGIVSHELKTPVTSLKAYGQILQNRLRKEGNTKAAEHLTKMDAQINKLSSLIEDLLDATKIEGDRLQFHEDLFDFDGLIDEIVEEVQRTTSDHHIVKEGNTVKTIYGDRERIGQVLTNLLTNAVKYSPSADLVKVRVSASEKEVIACVQDYGIGIAEEKQPHVFERFFRVSDDKQETYPGIGLGLFIAKEIITRQGGHIWMESQKGEGSTFCFRLPILKREDHR